MTVFPEPSFIDTNGIRMAVYEQGAGQPVVLCHGFPELAYSWRHQLPALAAAGFHAIAPDQRGYGRTDRPAAIEAYDIVRLTDDMVGLLDALGLEKAVFCGHDWGGIVVWALPLVHPDRVAGVISLNTPFLPRPPPDPIALMREKYGEDMYIVRFQEPGVADSRLAADVARTFRFFMRRGGLINRVVWNRLPGPAKRLALLKALELPEWLWPGHCFLAPEELDVFVRTYERTGFTGGINWYRNFTRNWELSAGIEERVHVPCLMISAANDVVLRPEMAAGMEAYVPDLEKHVIPECGHWTQQEKPAETNRLIVDWLVRRFGRTDLGREPRSLGNEVVGSKG